MERHADCIIIGAGIGGLTAGSILARKGRKVIVLEKQKKAGGYAQNFTRRGFTFDASLHSTTGPSEGNHMEELLSECGVLDRIEFIPQKHLFRFISPDFDIRIRNSDLEGYIGQLAEFFPSEEPGIKGLLAEIESAYQSVIRLDRSKLPSLLNLVLFPFLYPKLVRYDRATVEQVMSKFVKDEKLICILSAFWSFFGLPPGKLAFSYFFFPFIDYLKNGGCIVKGGSGRLTEAYTGVIQENGGQILTRSEVKNILLKRKRVCGVETDEGVFFAPDVISNIPPMSTLEMAGMGNFREKYLGKVRNQKIAISGIQVYLGLDCPLDKLGVSSEDYIISMVEDYDLESQYLKCLGNRLENAGGGFGITCFSNLDPDMAPAGKSTLSLFNLAGGKSWLEMEEDEYRRKKSEVTALLIRKAERIIPGLSQHIEVSETATPRTFWKYTGNPEGTFHGYEQSVPQAGALRRFSRKYPIKGLYHVGAWTFPGGGYAGAMFSARQLVRKYFK